MTLGRVLCACATLVLSTSAIADPAPLTNSNYAIDLYSGAASGNTQIIGMGGAAVAMAQGSTATMINPAAAGVRASTADTWFQWDLHFDGYLAPSSKDYDNNGLTLGTGNGVQNADLGGQLQFGNLGFANSITATNQDLPARTGPSRNAQVYQVEFAAAYGLANNQLVLGGGFRVGELLVNQGATTLFSLSAISLDGGGVWKPELQNFRVGASISVPVADSNLTYSSCDPSNCDGYILPTQIDIPWHVSGGVAYRFAPTSWNRSVPGPFRDERSLTIAADVIITGSADNAIGLEAFGQQVALTSGATVVIGERLGAEFEAFPGHLRLRAGTYWEPGRNEGIGGRAHTTFGIEVGAIDFTFFGKRRLRASITGDLARDYGNVALSLGLWN